MSEILSSLPKEKLTDAQEAELIEKGDTATLVLHNMREAFPYARTCYGQFDDGELFSACYEGLLAAAKSFKPGGLRFFAHAKAHIRGVLNRRWKFEKDVVKNATHEELPMSGVHEVVNPEENPLEDGQVKHTAATLSKRAFQVPHTAPDFSRIDLRERWDDLKPVLKKFLDPQRQMVLELHYQGGLSFSDIARLLDFSRQNCQEMHRSALLKIRRILATRKKLQNL